MIYHFRTSLMLGGFKILLFLKDSRAWVKTLAGIEEEISRTKEKTIKEHFKNHKDDLRFPPAWKTLEQTSLGTLSKLYGNLKNTK